MPTFTKKDIAYIKLKLQHILSDVSVVQNEIDMVESSETMPHADLFDAVDDLLSSLERVQINISPILERYNSSWSGTIVE